MKKQMIYILIVIVSLMNLGCSNGTQETVGVVAETVEMVTESLEDLEEESTEEMLEQQVLGTLNHGPSHIMQEGEDPKPFVYNGGEFNFEYSVVASGTAKKMGFLMFVGGEAQPYKTDKNDNYEYMHYFEMQEDDIEEKISFIFTPVTGNQGETLSLNIVSIYNAQFIPDMIETSNYGGFHSELAATSELYFESEPEEYLDTTEYSNNSIITSLEGNKEEMTQDFIENELTAIFMTPDITREILDKEINSYILVNDNLQYAELGFTKDIPIDITYKIFGAEGIEYTTTFYINHQPISYDNITSFDTTIEEGSIHNINLTIEGGNLKDLNTFYAVSVPVHNNGNKSIMTPLYKSPSILLYDTTIYDNANIENNSNSFGVGKE